MLNQLKKIIPRRLFNVLQPPYHFILGWLAALVYRFPSRKLIIIGVTGTTGKTSTVYLTAKMLNEAGYKTGFTSTAVISNGQREWLNDKKMTMPGRFFIQRLLRDMVKNNCRYALVETTSEGIKQFRHRFINYDVLVFTGIYPEHIESHGSFENYREAKGKLFAHLKYGLTKYTASNHQVVSPHSELKKLDLFRVAKTIIVNGDDDNVNYFLNFWSEAKLACSFKPEVTPDFFLKKLNSETMVKDFMVIKGEDIKATAIGTSLIINGEKVNLKLLGEFNAANALIAAAVGLNQNLTLTQIKAGLEEVRGLAGKLEKIEAGQDFSVIVDYSFEPLALSKLYQMISLIPHQKVIHLLGSAGGGRDKARRPLLGRLAAEKADFVVVTNEDPYDEDPAEIINQVAAGAEMAGKQNNVNLFKIMDRRDGIKKALTLAKKGDLVLFTGKGAEQSICLANGQKLPWDERDVVREEIVELLRIDKQEQL